MAEQYIIDLGNKEYSDKYNSIIWNNEGPIKEKLNKVASQREAEGLQKQSQATAER